MEAQKIIKQLPKRQAENYLANRNKHVTASHETGITEAVHTGTTAMMLQGFLPSEGNLFSKRGNQKICLHT